MDEILLPENEICEKCNQPTTNEFWINCVNSEWHATRWCCLIERSRTKPANKPTKHWQTLAKTKNRKIK